MDRTDPGPNGGRGVLGTGVYVLYVPPSSASPTGANAPRRGGRARADTQKLEIRKPAVIRERSYRAPSDTQPATEGFKSFLDPETGKVIRERQARAPSDTKPAQMDSSFSSLEFGTQRSNQGTVERHVLRRAPRDTKLAQEGSKLAGPRAGLTHFSLRGLGSPGPRARK